MRMARITLTFSFSIFLLSLSWALLTGQFAPVTDARAQSPGDFVSIATTQNGLFVAMTASGELWEFRHSTARQFGQVERLGQLPPEQTDD